MNYHVLLNDTVFSIVRHVSPRSSLPIVISIPVFKKETHMLFLEPFVYTGRVSNYIAVFKQFIKTDFPTFFGFYPVWVVSILFKPPYIKFRRLSSVRKPCRRFGPDDWMNRRLRDRFGLVNHAGSVTLRNPSTCRVIGFPRYFVITPVLALPNVFSGALEYYASANARLPAIPLPHLITMSATPTTVSAPRRRPRAGPNRVITFQYG